MRAEKPPLVKGRCRAERGGEVLRRELTKSGGFGKIDLALPISGKRLVPLTLDRGASCSLIFGKGDCTMSTSEVLQLCLVIIGICSLFTQVYKKK